FLSQRPNWGIGALADRVSGTEGLLGSGGGSNEHAELNEDDWNKFLYQPNASSMAWSGMSGAAAVAGSVAAGKQSYPTCTPPNGRGKVASAKSGADFYRDIGSAASQKGICIDMYLVAALAATSANSSGTGVGTSSNNNPQYFDLATLKQLSVLTGG